MTADERIRCWNAGVRARADLENLTLSVDRAIADGTLAGLAPWYEKKLVELDLDAADAVACLGSEPRWVADWRALRAKYATLPQKAPTAGTLERKLRTGLINTIEFDAWHEQQPAVNLPPLEPGEPPLIVFATDGYVTIRGPKHDLTAYLRLTDCDVDYEIYPAGQAPPSGSDDEVGEQHQRAQETIALDGGMWTTKNCKDADLDGIAADILEITGTRVRVGLAPPPGGGMDQAVRKALGLPEEDEDGEGG